MNFPITGPGGVKQTDKNKSTSKKAGTGGAAFASLLQQASEAGDVTAATSPLAVTAPYTPMGDDDAPPQNPQEQARQLLKTLQQLAEDAFANQPTQALHNLQKNINAIVPHRDTLTPAQQQALSELETRAAVEAEKLSK